MNPTPVHTADPSTSDHDPARWRALILLSTALSLGMAMPQGNENPERVETTVRVAVSITETLLLL